MRQCKLQLISGSLSVAIFIIDYDCIFFCSIISSNRDNGDVFGQVGRQLAEMGPLTVEKPPSDQQVIGAAKHCRPAVSPGHIGPRTPGKKSDHLPSAHGSTSNKYMTFVSIADVKLRLPSIDTMSNRRGHNRCLLSV